MVHGERKNRVAPEDHLRLKMGKSVVDYFRVIYKIKDSSAKSKNEALAAEASGAKSRV